MTESRRVVLAPAVVLFGIMVAHAVLETARDALFLARLGPQHLAFAYLAIAALATVVAIVLRRRRGAPPRRTLLSSLAVATIGTTVLAWAIRFEPSLAFVLYVWTGLVATLVVPTFWTAMDRSLRVNEAKRVFAAIGAGGVLGATVGSAMAGALGRVTAAHHLVTAGAMAFALTTVAAFALAPRDANDELPTRRRDDDVSHRSRRYVRLLVAIGIVSTMTLTIADLTFKRALAERLAPEDLATAFGTIYMLLNLASLAIQVVVTPRLLARWGVGSALTVLPVVLVATASGFAMTGALIAVLALKLGDGSLRHSLHRVASEILYLPVPEVLRDRSKPAADAISQRGGQALAALLWLIVSMTIVPTRVLGIVVVVLAVAWLIAIRVVERGYVAQFRDLLHAGELERGARIPDLDSNSVSLLTAALSSPDEAEALAALELLARGGHISALVLYHPRASVVRRALALLPAKQRPDVIRVLGHLIEHPDSTIRAAALMAASRSGTGRSQLEAAAAEADPGIRAAALVGLAGASADHEIDERIRAMAQGSPAERVALARAIAYAPDEQFRGVLYELLATQDARVRRETLRLLASSPQLAELERILPFLEDAHVRGDARRVFLAAGPAGLETLLGALDDARTPIGIRRHLPRTISRYRTPRAADALVTRLLREPDGTTEFKLLRALGRMRADEPTLAIDAATMHAYVLRSVDDAVRYTCFLDHLLETDLASSGADLIRDLVRDKRRWAIEHTFRALGILHPHDELRSVHDAIVGANESRRSAAREILESLLAADVRQQLLAVLDDLPADERRVRLGAHSLRSFPTQEDLYTALLADPSNSLKCVVAHHIAECNLVALRHQLERLRPHIGPPLVTYAFDQAIERLHA